MDLDKETDAQLEIYVHSCDWKALRISLPLLLCTRMENNPMLGLPYPNIDKS